MLNSRKLVIAASIFAATDFLVSGERAEAITGNASAQIAIPVTIAETTALDHGTVTASGSLGTVTISTAGVRGVTGGVGALGGSPPRASSRLPVKPPTRLPPPWTRPARCPDPAPI
jgi:hypothetical protein